MGPGATATVKRIASLLADKMGSAIFEAYVLALLLLRLRADKSNHDVSSGIQATPYRPDETRSGNCRGMRIQPLKSMLTAKG